MTAKKLAGPGLGITTEDAFGTPPQARGSMMNVAGKTDDDLRGEQLITDDAGEPDEYNGNDTVGAPVYEGDKVMMTMGQLREIIRKSGNKYVLMTKHRKKGKHRKLGTHSSKTSAERQERAIHANGG